MGGGEQRFYVKQGLYLQYNDGRGYSVCETSQYKNMSISLPTLSVKLKVRIIIIISSENV